MPILIKIYGSVHDPSTFACEYLAQRIAREKGESNVAIEFNKFLEIDYLQKLSELRKIPEYPSANKKTGPRSGTLNAYLATHIVFIDPRGGGNESSIPLFVGNFEAFATLASEDTDYGGFEDSQIYNSIIANRNAREEPVAMMTATGRPVVAMEFQNASSLSSKEAQQLKDMEFGKIYIELLTQYCPKACDNFAKLCEKGYENCSIHRLVKGGWLQTGDVVDSSGKNSVPSESSEISSAGGVRDESFSVDFGKLHGGIVGFCNDGAHTNGSQFFITLGPCEWMNTKFVGFGRVVQGYKVLRSMNLVPVENQVPTLKVEIVAASVEINSFAIRW